SACKVLVISYHSGDAYQFEDGLQRSKITAKVLGNGGALPSVQFDTKIRIDSTLKDTNVNPPKVISAYPLYRPVYDSLILQKTPISLTLSKQKGRTYKECKVSASIKLENPLYEGKERMQLMAVVTESHIPIAWKNQSSIEFAARSMYNGNKGQRVQLNSNGEAKIEFTMLLDTMWETQHCEIICWVQDSANLQVLESSHIAILEDTITNLEKPLNFQVQNIAGTLSAAITWSSPLPNAKYTVIGYNIFQKGKLVNKTGILTDTFYISPKLNFGENCFSIQTIYDCKSILSDTVCITITPLPTPTHLDSTVLRTPNYTLVNLSWQAPKGYEAESENASNLKAYFIYRDGKKIGETLPTLISFRDSLLYKGTYTYSVSALYRNKGIEIESNKSESINVPFSIDGSAIETDSKYTITLYPNPCHTNQIFLSKEVQFYSIYNLNGKQILQGNTPTHQIDVSSLQNGMYIVKMDGHHFKLTILR
ncbi:MAG: T9SS type A sorting domain-containing protein, partial [Bacteroidales bacterium]